MTHAPDEERALRAALEEAQHALKESERRVEQLRKSALEREVDSRARQLPLEQALAEARQRFEAQAQSFEARARELTREWQAEVLLREAALKQLRGALEATGHVTRGDDRCRRCGHEGLLHNVMVLDSDRANSLLGVGRSRSTLRAVVCGGCGHTELWAENPVSLVAAAKERSR